MFLAGALLIAVPDQRDYKNGDPNTRLDPWYVTGLADGEGNFSISTTVRPNGSTKVSFAFKVTQIDRNAGVLYDLERFFGVGSVVIDNREDGTLKYHVQGQDDILNVIIPHFDQYPLVTSKSLNYLEAFAIHRSMGSDGLEQVKTLKAGMNKGRSFDDKFASVDITVLQPMWVLGFADGEGLFYVYVAVKKRCGSYFRSGTIIS